MIESVGMHVCIFNKSISSSSTDSEQFLTRQQLWLLLESWPTVTGSASSCYSLPLDLSVCRSGCVWSCRLQVSCHSPMVQGQRGSGDSPKGSCACQDNPEPTMNLVLYRTFLFMLLAVARFSHPTTTPSMCCYSGPSERYFKSLFYVQGYLSQQLFPAPLPDWPPVLHSKCFLISNTTYSFSTYRSSLLVVFTW